MGHLAIQSARDLAAGALIGVAADTAHEHLDDCGACRERVAALLRADDTDGISATSAVAIGTPPTLEPIEPLAPLELDSLAQGAHDTTVANAPHARARKPAAPQVDRLDEYKLVELLGRGGMGTVYRARDTLLERDVAIKLIARASSDIARQRFLVEARAVARIRHPNVVVVHRVGIAGDLPYIVYELVRGRTLDALSKPMAWPKVVERAVGITRGLAAAHACGVLHRDLKPQNLMIDDNDDVVLVDFGLAKLDDDVTIATPTIDVTAALAIETPVTVTGIALGTPRYMAPEAWRGLDPTPQTDVYSVGVVMYELLAARSPFAETAIDSLARRVCTEDPPPLADHAPWVPAALAALVDRCVARDPARRPATAAAIGDELEAIQRGRAFETFVRDRVPRAPAGNPYKADQPFGIDDAAVLFGRGDELRAVVDAVRSRPLVVVTGDDGVGKTSLCRAGLLPIIRHGALGGARRWMPVSVVLGTRPVAALADALAVHVEQPRDVVEAAVRADPTEIVVKFRAGHRSGCAAHVVYIDALDDVLAAPPAEAAIFARVLAMLAEPSVGVRVIASARTRNLGAIAALPGLGTAIGPAVYFLAEPRDPAALREIVAEPARLGGRPLAAPVVDELVGAAARGELRLRDLEIELARRWDAR